MLKKTTKKTPIIGVLLTLSNVLYFFDFNSAIKNINEISNQN